MMSSARRNKIKMEIVMPAWIAGIQDRKDAFPETSMSAWIPVDLRAGMIRSWS